MSWHGKRVKARFSSTVWQGIAVLVLLLPGLLPAMAQSNDLKRLPVSEGQMRLSFAPIVRKTAPSVVNVYSLKITRTRSRSPFLDDPFFRRFFGDSDFGVPRKKVQRSLGSGVIVEPQGIVVTNFHVIKGGTSIKVALSDGREFEADVILRDKRTDLAVLRLRAKGETFPHISYSDSDAIEVGDLVLAIGNPFGVGQTVTSGIVSAVARTRVGISDYQFFIQTDAAINPGNSGGALLDMDGRLVGINTAIYTRSGGSNGIGFAIPVNMVRAVVNSAKVGHRVRRPWIGAQLQKITPAIAESLGMARPGGVLIRKIIPGGPADEAGLRRGDVIVRFGGREVANPQELNYRMAIGTIGETSAIEFLRGGSRMNSSIMLTTAPERPARNETTLRDRSPFSGARVANLNPALAEELGRNYEQPEVIVLAVRRGSPARRIGLKPGDIITEINNRRIRKVRDLKNALRLNDYEWAIAVRRKGRVLRTTIRR